MQVQLPMFEGHHVHGATLKLTGKSDQAIGALSHGEEVILLIRGTVSKIAHGDAKVGADTVFAREHVVKASRVVILDQAEGERMLDEAIMLADDRFGIQSILGPSSGPDSETGEIPE